MGRIHALWPERPNDRSPLVYTKNAEPPLLSPARARLRETIAALDEALAHIVAHDGVWLATGREIAAWYTEHYYDVFSKWLAAGTPGGRR